MSSVSGLPLKQRVIARDRTVQAAMLGYHHRDEIHYTQGDGRWNGIDNHRIAKQGEFPHQADCSAYVTWCLWNGLHVPFKLKDHVNGLDWKAGWTGTLCEHGKRVSHINDVRRGDVVLYGSGAPFHHTAIIVDRKDGKPIVVSHGSEGGPYLLPYNYRSDVGQIRRYI